MSDRQPTRSAENEKVLAISTLIAGLAGGFSVLIRSKSKSAKERQMLAQLVEDRRKELAEVNSALAIRRKELSVLLASASKQSRKALKDLNIPAMELTDVDWSSFSRRAHKGLERARREAIKHAPPDMSGSRDSIRKSRGDAAASARTFGERAVEQVSRRAAEFIENAGADIAPHARNVSDRASGVAATTVASSKDAAEAIRHRVDEAKPHLENLANRAIDAARQGAEDVKPRLEELTGKAKSAAVHAPDAFTTEFHKAEEALGAITSTVQDKASEAAHAVEAKSRAGASAVKQGGKDGSSLLFWLGTAASVTYFVILSDEQREKVRHIAGRVLSEAREIYADIQGEDGKF